MQLLPMASSPDGLISARYAVITKMWGHGLGDPTQYDPFGCIVEHGRAPRGSEAEPTQRLCGPSGTSKGKRKDTAPPARPHRAAGSRRRGPASRCWWTPGAEVPGLECWRESV